MRGSRWKPVSSGLGTSVEAVITIGDVTFGGGLDLVLLDLAEQLFNRLLGTLSVAQNSWVLNQAPSEVEESTLLLLQKACNVALHYGRH